MRLPDAARAALGADVVRTERLAGGDLSEVVCLTLGDGRRVVAKRAEGAGREAAMLQAIRAAGCPAPEVYHAEADLILMERLEGGGRPGARDWAEAGTAVARLHAAQGPGYGWVEDHAFGAAAIPGGFTDDWPGFWAEARLLAWPGALPADVAERVGVLARRLPDLLPPAPPPALLHGDLWAGNLMFGNAGFSGLIDPAACYGDGEADLAMLTLFGAPPPAFFEDYGTLSPGWEARRPVYQIWPALVHLRLFGAGYRGLVDRLLTDAGV